MVYNIEKVDQDIAKSLAPASKLSVEFRKDLLGACPSSPVHSLTARRWSAIPNFVRMNRNPRRRHDRPHQTPDGRPQDSRARHRHTPASVVWITEG
jgi:hypothetical protein